MSSGGAAGRTTSDYRGPLRVSCPGTWEPPACRRTSSGSAHVAVEVHAQGPADFHKLRESAASAPLFAVQRLCLLARPGNGSWSFISFYHAREAGRSFSLPSLRHTSVSKVVPRSVDLAALVAATSPGEETMADLKELADQAAAELLKAIRDHAGKAGDSSLLNLAQAYSYIVSTEVSTRLADENATAMAESLAESMEFSAESMEFPPGVLTSIHHPSTPRR